MKKAILLVAVFLGGITTQTFAQRRQNVTIQPENANHYSNTQSISFVEDGILFSVNPEGAFDFSFLENRKNKHDKGYKNHKVNYYGKEKKNHHDHSDYKKRGKIKTDDYGNIVKIGKTKIDYNRYGSVIQIGHVPLFYVHGRLQRVGNLEINYNRFGEIRDTRGFVNRHNSNSWHNDWYTYSRRNEVTFRPETSRIRKVRR